MMRLGLLLGDKSANQIPDQGQYNVTSLRDEQYHYISAIGTCGDGTPDRGISDSSPLSTLTASSGSDKGIHTYNSTVHHSRDPSTDSMTSLMSTSTGHSISPHTTTNRPHSITTSTPGAIEDLNLFGRKSKLRRSARATIGYSEGPKMITPICPPQLHLTPIAFEIPHSEGTAMFVGREWVYKDIDLVCVCTNDCLVNIPFLTFCLLKF